MSQFWSPQQKGRGRSTLAAGADPVCYRFYFGVAVLPKNLFKSSSLIAHEVRSMIDVISHCESSRGWRLP
jgi:hypothetical protein